MMSLRHERGEQQVAVRQPVQRGIENEIERVLVVSVIFQPYADVVHERGHAEHFYVHSRQFVEHAQLLVQHYGQVAHLFAVLYVLVAVVQLSVYRMRDDVADRFLRRRGHGMIEHDALAQAGGRYEHTLERAAVEEGLDGRERGDEYVGAFLLQAFYLGALVYGQNLDRVVYIRELVLAHSVVVYH